MAKKFYLPFPVIIVLCLFFVPLVIKQSFIIYLLSVSAIYSIVGVGLILLLGYSGQISIGHAAFLGIGAYISALLTIKTGLAFWPALLLSAVGTGVVGFLIGLPALRLHGHYLAIATLGFGVIVPQILLKWEKLTHGFKGLLPPKPKLGSYVFDTDASLYYLNLVIAVILVFMAYNMLRSKTGRALIALKDNDLAAQAMGINIARYRVMAFTISAFYAGVAGSLYAHSVGFISPYDFNLWLSFNFLAMVVIGGLASIEGGIYGALFVVLVPALFGRIKDMPHIIFGVCLFLVIFLMPTGILGIRKKLSSLLVSFGGKNPEVPVKTVLRGRESGNE